GGSLRVQGPTGWDPADMFCSGMLVVGGVRQVGYGSSIGYGYLAGSGAGTASGNFSYSMLISGRALIVNGELNVLSDERRKNHLGSIDVAMEVDNNQANWYLYYQHPFEDKSGVAFQNLPDGLYGIRWKNARFDSRSGFRLTQLTVEFLTTMNQSGFDFEIGSRLYNGADDYFNNYQYVDGWTHRRRVIGTPFLTPWLDSREDLHNLKGGYKNHGPMAISNNRVNVGHLGLLGQWPSGTQLRALLSFSRNFGRPMSSDPRAPFSQFSGMAQLVLPVNWLGGSQISMAVALDQGQWLTNNAGGWLSLRKVIQRR
ncbi:MAG: hypothetical protein EOO39_45665, partial [Cytophagaceae bacterium]